MNKICVLIPVLNESQAIGAVVAEVRAKNLDVVVVDDGSTDNSKEIAAKNGAIVIRHQTRKGKGQSLRDGFHFLLQQGYNGVVTIDGDGQHDPGDIDQFMNLLAAGSVLGEAEGRQKSFGIIVGSRMSNPKGMPCLRYLTNRFMSFLISWACGQNVPDTQCGYRYIDADVLREVSLDCDDFEIETEMLMKAAKKGFNIGSVPIKTIYRNEESKINPWKDTIRFIKYFTKEIFE